MPRTAPTRDPRVGAVERRGADQPEHEAPAVAADRERAVLAVELAGRSRGSARGAAARARRASPPWRGPRARAPSRGTSACASRASASGTGGTRRRRTSLSAMNDGQAGEQQHRDGPRRERDEQRAEARRSEIAFCTRPKLRITSDSGRARGLAPRARQLVVELGVLELARARASAPSRGSSR